MAFTFLHAADLHLGSPLTGLALKDEAVARRFSRASRDALSELVTRALAEKVAFVLIAGDIYDGDWKDTSIGLFFNREVARLHRANIPVFFIRGNHDAESEITKAVSLPDGVIDFASRKAETKRLDDLRVAIHGRSFADRVAQENYAVAYPEPEAGWFNIGVLHTSMEGNAAHAVYAPCSRQDLLARGYDYWALGHIHEYAVLHQDPWIVYSGNLQGRSVRECGEKGAVLVTVEDGRVSGLRRMVVDKARWLNESLDVAAYEDEGKIIDAVSAALTSSLPTSEGRLTAVRVTLTGMSGLHGALKSRTAHLRDEIQARLHHLHEDAWLESLKIATQSPVVRRSATGGVDPESLLAGLEDDPALIEQAREIMARVRAKLPAGLDAGALEDLGSIMSDARALAASRATEQTGR